MKARKVYEAIGDIFVGKDIETIMKDFDLSNYPREFAVMARAVIEMGYTPELSPLYDPEEMTKKTYSFQGKTMDYHIGLYFKLRAQQELDEMEHLYNDSMYNENAHIDHTGLGLLKLHESGECVMDFNIRCDGYWPSMKNDEGPYRNFPMIYGLKTDEEIKKAARKLIPMGERFLSKEVKKLKEYAENW